MRAAADRCGDRIWQAAPGIHTATECGRGIRVRATPGSLLIHGAGCPITPERGRFARASDGAGDRVRHGWVSPTGLPSCREGPFPPGLRFRGRESRVVGRPCVPRDRNVRREFRTRPCFSRIAHRSSPRRWTGRETSSSRGTRQGSGFLAVRWEACVESRITWSVTDSPIGRFTHNRRCLQVGQSEALPCRPGRRL